MADDKDILHAAREAFEEARDAEDHNRLAYIEDIRFAKLGEQWPDKVVQQREREKRPCLTINKMPAFLRQVVNDARMNKPSIKVRAADSSADPHTADIMSGLIRNIEHVSNADVAYDTAIEHSAAGGFGYWRVSLDYAFDDAFDLDILIEPVRNPLSVYGDPSSTSADSADWNVCFVTERITKAEFERRYGDKATVDFDADDWAELSDDWMSEEGVLIAEYWTREEVEKDIVRLSDGRILAAEDLEADEQLAQAIAFGMIRVTGQRTIKAHKVTQYIMSGLEVLETNDWPGSFIPIVPVYGDDFIIEGKRYLRSLINPAKDAQRMFNYWRTTSTELVALSPRVPFIGPKGAFSGDNGWNTANTVSHAYLEYEVIEGAAPPQRQPLDMGVAAGALQEALNASDDMKAIIGLYDASLGARSNETSGKAIMARQREGDVSTFHFIDNLSRAIRHTGRILIDLIPHVYDQPRIVRILGEDGKEKTVPVNQPTQEVDEQGQAIQRIYDLSLGKYDLAVESGPSFTTRREELAMTIQQFVQAVPDAAGVLGPEMVRAMDFPNAQKLAEKLEAMLGGGIPPQVQKQIEEGMQRIKQLEAENQQLKADRQIDQAKVQVDQFEAETDRIKVVHDIQQIGFP
jgi:hypothetical protein